MSSPLCTSGSQQFVATATGASPVPASSPSHYNGSLGLPLYTAYNFSGVQSNGNSSMNLADGTNYIPPTSSPHDSEHAFGLPQRSQRPQSQSFSQSNTNQQQMTYNVACIPEAQWAQLNSQMPPAWQHISPMIVFPPSSQPGSVATSTSQTSGLQSSNTGYTIMNSTSSSESLQNVIPGLTGIQTLRMSVPQMYSNGSTLQMLQTTGTPSEPLRLLSSAADGMQAISQQAMMTNNENILLATGSMPTSSSTPSFNATSAIHRGRRRTTTTTKMIGGRGGMGKGSNDTPQTMIPQNEFPLPYHDLLDEYYQDTSSHEHATSKSRKRPRSQGPLPSLVEQRLREGVDDKKGKKMTSRYSCVSWNRNARKWQAYMRIQGKRIHLGYYTDESEAAAAVARAKAELPGRGGRKSTQQTNHNTDYHTNHKSKISYPQSVPRTESADILSAQFQGSGTPEAMAAAAAAAAAVPGHSSLPYDASMLAAQFASPQHHDISQALSPSVLHSVFNAAASAPSMGQQSHGTLGAHSESANV